MGITSPSTRTGEHLSVSPARGRGQQRHTADSDFMKKPVGLGKQARRPLFFSMSTTRISRLQEQILADLAATNGDRQSINDLAGQWPGRTVSGVRKAVDSLYKRAMVIPSGWEPGCCRRSARVWNITASGRAALDAEGGN